MKRPILNYHAIGSTSSSEFAPWVIGPQQFDDHLDLISNLGLRGVSMAHALAEPAPDQVALTFDDGYEDFVTAAVPALRDRGFTATLFVATAYVGDRSEWLEPDGDAVRKMASWTQLREAAEQGFEIGSHSQTHPQLDLLAPDQVVAELTGSRAKLEAELGRPIDGFCYPHGFHGSQVRQAAIDAGYDYACAVKHKMSNDDDDRFALSRIIVTADIGCDQLDAMLLGDQLRTSPSWAEHTMARGFREYRRLRARLGR